MEEPNFMAFFRDSQIPMHEIEEGLFLGSLEAAKDRSLLQEKGVTHILSLLDTFRYMEKFEGFEYLQIEIADSPNSNIVDHVPQALSFIAAGLRSGKILVHCAAGVSRSASIVISYIMVKYSYEFDVAKALVKSKRGCIWPNMGFQRQISTIRPEAYKRYLN